MKTATSSHAARQRDVRAMGPYEGRGLLSHSGPWPPLHTATSAKRFRVQGDGAGQEQEGEAGASSARDGEMRGLTRYTCLLHENMKHQQQRSPNASCRGRHSGVRAAARWTCPLSRGCTVEAAPTGGTSASCSSSCGGQGKRCWWMRKRRARVPTQMRDLTSLT